MVASAVGALVAAVPSAASAPAWQPFVTVPGVFDVAGPLPDGRLVVAGTGGLSIVSSDGQITGFAPTLAPFAATES